MKRKTPAQLDREIDASLTIPGIKTTAHSAKALTTLAQMNTSPADWALTPIEWVEEEREVPGWVTCPSCLGRKFVKIENGVVVPPPRGRDAPYGSTAYKASEEYDKAAHAQASAENRHYGNCPRCGKQKGGWGSIPQGTIKGIVRKLVRVGYPKFPKGTRFDGRFGGGGAMHCGLCNKTIMKSGRVPVHGTGSDGVTHGLFVGEDCARKFLGVKLKRDEDSIMESGNGRG